MIDIEGLVALSHLGAPEPMTAWEILIVAVCFAGVLYIFWKSRNK